MGIQLHKILVGFVMVAVIMTGMMLFISSGTDNYSMEDYDNKTFSSFNKLEQLRNQTKQFDEDGDDVNSDNSLLDILGNFFTNMYTSAKIFKGSADIMTDMGDQGIDKLGVDGAFSVILKAALSLVFMIILSVGIFLAFVTKSERT